MIFLVFCGWIGEFGWLWFFRRGFTSQCMNMKDWFFVCWIGRMYFNNLWKFWEEQWYIFLKNLWNNCNKCTVFSKKEELLGLKFWWKSAWSTLLVYATSCLSSNVKLLVFTCICYLFSCFFEPKLPVSTQHLLVFYNWDVFLECR